MFFTSSLACSNLSCCCCSLQTKVSSLEGFRERCTQLEVKLATLEKEKAQWSAFLEKGDKREFDSPVALSKKLSTVRSENAILKDEQGNLTALLRAKDVALEKAHKLAEQLRAEKEAVEEAKEREARAVRRLENSNSRYQQQVELFKRQLDSFDREQTVLMGGLIDESKSARITHLETQLADCQRSESTLLADIKAKDEELASLHARVKELLAASSQPAPMDVDGGSSSRPGEFALRQENVRLQAECQTLQKEIDSLVAQVNDLEQKVAQGDFDPAKVKVLHLTMNPERMAQEERAQTLAALKAENEQLAKRVAELTEGGQGHHASQPVIAFGEEASLAIQQKSQLLEKKLKETELKMQRLKEVFGKKITEFREACYSLTGFKIEMKEAEYKLSSMFAEREADFLMFQRDSDGNMQFLETDFSKTIPHILTRYLRRSNSIPAILSSLTLELFEKQTFM